jgi:DNA-binding transcriptional MerR regulator
MEKQLPPIPAKRYFTIGEVSELCGVKPYVLRYWEQEFTQLKPMKRRGNRRYYQHHEVLLVRRIRELLYDQGFTISGARNRLADAPAPRAGAVLRDLDGPDHVDDEDIEAGGAGEEEARFALLPPRASIMDSAAAMPLRQSAVDRARLSVADWPNPAAPPIDAADLSNLRHELLSIRELLGD